MNERGIEMNRVAITGSTGMIGSALARHLAARGVEVLALAHSESSRLNRAFDGDSSGITVIPCPGTGYAKLAESPDTAKLPRCDVFYHFAWSGTLGKGRGDEERQRANVQMALDAVRLAHALGCERFVFAGSQAEYGTLEGKFSANTPCHPVTPYGKAKLLAETQTRTLAHELGMEHIATRIGSVYGPGDNDGTVLMQAIRHALDDEPFACTAGEQLWDHIYCDDAARAFALIGQEGRPDAVYPIGTGRVEPLHEHIQLACEACNPAFTPEFGALPYPDKQVMYLCADIEELQHDTGFEAIMPFEEGIRRTARWYREAHTIAAQAPGERQGEPDVVA